MSEIAPERALWPEGFPNICREDAGVPRGAVATFAGRGRRVERHVPFQEDIQKLSKSCEDRLLAGGRRSQSHGNLHH
jgi:hypothetical protein